ncbi:hypothetical protein OBBRIDRAFT_483059 [Obba rivulosa]|uniref:Uncharacterized protein n=1 Tax=Obba rivulosa TaxID=1052685 RepID=A0A8E2AK84_9APHY|nr:hypothetical protein OBBRIDRAFT_483059 [Obba rivulosa]
MNPGLTSILERPVAATHSAQTADASLVHIKLEHAARTSCSNDQTQHSAWYVSDSNIATRCVWLGNHLSTICPAPEGLTSRSLSSSMMPALLPVPATFAPQSAIASSPHAPPVNRLLHILNETLLAFVPASRDMYCSSHLRPHQTRVPCAVPHGRNAAVRAASCGCSAWISGRP